MKKIAIVLSVLLIPVLVFLLANCRMAAYYNEGNRDYREKQYEDAIEEYRSALRWFPLEEQECDIRINLAKAIIASIDFDNLNTKEDVDQAIETLKDAKEVLLENGYASDSEEGGSSKEAQELKEDIDQKIEELENANGSSDSGEDGDDSDETDENDQNGQETEETDIGGMSQEEIDSIEQELQEIEEEGSEERYEDLFEYQEFDSEYYWSTYSGSPW